MSETPTIELNPSDALGVVQRGLHELQVYLNGTEAMRVDVPAAMAHIERLLPFLAKLQEMQMAAMETRPDAEARAN